MLKEGEEVEMNCTFIANPEVTEIDWFQNVSKNQIANIIWAWMFSKALHFGYTIKPELTTSSEYQPLICGSIYLFIA